MSARQIELNLFYQKVLDLPSVRHARSDEPLDHDLDVPHVAKLGMTQQPNSLA
jgi:hypothetical protein